MDNNLFKQKCVPCEGNVLALTRAQFSHYLPMVPSWNVIDDKKIEREFKFKNFIDSVKFINKVATLAENEGHHPDIYLHNWNKVKITLTTHKIKGLFLNDFILASKIDQILFSF